MAVIARNAQDIERKVDSFKDYEIRSSLYDLGRFMRDELGMEKKGRRRFYEILKSNKALYDFIKYDQDFTNFRQKSFFKTHPFNDLYRKV